MDNKRVLILLLASSLFLPPALQLFSHVLQSSTAVSRIAYVLSKIFLAAVPIAYWKLSRTPPTSRKNGTVLFGIFSGLFLCAVILGVLYPFIDDLRPFGETIRDTLSNLGLLERFWLYASAIIIVNSLLEELYWRYAVFGGLETIVSPLHAMLISSAGFAAMHLVFFTGLFHATWLILLLTAISFLFGMFWAWLYRRTRSVLSVWMNHALVNLPLFYIEWLIISTG